MSGSGSASASAPSSAAERPLPPPCSLSHSFFIVEDSDFLREPTPFLLCSANFAEYTHQKERNKDINDEI